MQNEISVPVGQVAAFLASLSNLARRAAKLGVAAPVAKLIAADVAVITPWKNSLDENIVVACNRYSVESATIVVAGGWYVAAIVDHLDEGNLIRRTITGPTAPELPAADTLTSRCEHCNVNRRRNQTMICVNAAGERKQVGSTCVREFCGIDPLHVLFALDVTALFSRCNAVSDEWEADEYAVARSSTVPTFRAVFAGWLTVHEDGGWIAKTQYSSNHSSARAAGKALDRGTLSTGDKAADEAGRAACEAAIEWARNLEPKNDFEHSLHTIATVAHLPKKFAGIAAYLTVAHTRFLRDEAEKAANANSKHYGVVGTRYRKVAVTVVRTASWDTQFGTQHLTVFRTESGELLATKSSNPFGDLAPGTPIDFTVKSHGEFKGTAQTEVTRVKAA